MSSSAQAQILRCPHQEVCAGCTSLHLSPEAEKNTKIQDLQRRWQDAFSKLAPEISYVRLPEKEFREKADLTYERNHLGFYAKEKAGVFALESCLVLHPDLNRWITQLQDLKWPIQKGSVRCRRGPQGLLGIWLDFANLDIKQMLETESFLNSLFESSKSINQKPAIIEIGQKRKALTSNPQGQLKLADPHFNIWTQTFVDDQPIDLYSAIGGFTQVSSQSNRLFSKVIKSYLSSNQRLGKAIEFGSGIGTLSFPLLQHTDHLTCCEFDSLASTALQKSIQLHPKLANQIQLLTADFQRSHNLKFADYDLIAINPPRSGMMNFLAPLESLDLAKRPRYVFYMSCFAESFIKDSGQLQNLGYKIQRLDIIDQFPHTAHYEILSLWKIT